MVPRRNIIGYEVHQRWLCFQSGSTWTTQKNYKIIRNFTEFHAVFSPKYWKFSPARGLWTGLSYRYPFNSPRQIFVFLFVFGVLGQKTDENSQPTTTKETIVTKASTGKGGAQRTRTCVCKISTPLSTERRGHVYFWAENISLIIWSCPVIIQFQYRIRFRH